jgi:hypothetical protein
VATLRWTHHSSKESYHLYKNDYETEEEARTLQRTLEPLMKGMNIPHEILMLREEYGPRICKNRLLRRMFGPMRDAATRRWREPHNNRIKENDMGRACSLNGR